MDNDIVPQYLGHSLGHQQLSNRDLGIPDEVVSHHQDVASPFLSLLLGTGNQGALAPGDGLLQCFPWESSAVCLDSDALAAFLNMLFHLHSHLGPEEMVTHQVEQSFEA